MDSDSLLNSEDWRVTALGLLFLFFALAAFGSLLWWMFFLNKGSSAAPTDTSSGGDSGGNGSSSSEADTTPKVATTDPKAAILPDPEPWVAPEITSEAGDSDASAVEEGEAEVDQSVVAANALIANSFVGESVGADPLLGVVYRSQPDQVDDLTEINGVGSAEESQLNSDGVWRFKQIANWSDDNVEQFDQRLSSPGRIEREEWVPQAKGFASADDQAGEGLVEEPEPDVPAEAVYEGLVEKYQGESVHLDQKLGVLFEETANCEDDLTQIKGVGKVLKKTLNERGVFRFQQIADWNDYNVWSFNRIISFPGRIQRDQWIQQSAELATTSHCSNPGKARVTSEDLESIISDEFEGEDVEIREPFGIVYKSAPANADNLQDIRGVGPVLEKKLHAFGVYRFKQIANWPNEAIDEFQDQLSFPDRIRRDDWVGQCTDLAKA